MLLEHYEKLAKKKLAVVRFKDKAEKLVLKPEFLRCAKIVCFKVANIERWPKIDQLKIH